MQIYTSIFSYFLSCFQSVGKKKKKKKEECIIQEISF